ncbi:MAG: OmpA family protein, partial [Bacteroidota bacterium]
DEGAQTSSADGKLLFFTGCYRKGGLGNCDLYYTSLKNGKWQDIKHPKEPLNSAQWDSQPSLSANGGLLYFASKRPGGYGGRDIYYSYRQADGNWGKPINAGPVINTAGDEQSPFLHADGQTLYFMSDGHPGLGDADLFISRIGREGTWLKPVNLGSPINTSREEGGLVVSLDGKMAYYTTDQNTKEGGQLNFDIYQFPLYEGARPQAVTYVQGTVTDAKNKRKLAGATVRILVEEENRILAQPMTDTEGQFLVVLPAGRNYQLQVDKVDYLFYSDRFALADASSLEEPFELTVALARVPSVANPTAADPIVLRNVQFASGEAELLAASNQELLRLTQLLQTYPDLRIEITGHTDNVGQPSDNLRLSEARAQAVYNYIVEAGIATDRLSYQGFGEEKPIADNDTEEGRARNRRTEFVVVE